MFKFQSKDISIFLENFFSRRMNLTTQRMIGECVEKRSKFNFIMGQLPSELQLEILDYIPRKVIFEPEELAFLQLFYIFTFNNYLEDYSSWFTKVNNFDFIECFDDVLENTSELDYEYLIDYYGDEAKYYDESDIDIFFKMIPDDLRKNRAFMNALIKKDSKARHYVIEPMTDQNSLTVNFTEEQFSYYRRFALHFVSTKETYHESYDVYKVLCRELQNDREIVLGIMENDIYPIREGRAEELRNDREIVLKTVQEHGDALEFASDNLKNDKEIVLSAIKNYGWAFTWASDRLKNDKEISLKAVQKYWKVYEKIPDELKTNKEILFEAGYKSNLYSLRWLPDKIKNHVRSMLHDKKDDDNFKLIAQRMGINN